MCAGTCGCMTGWRYHSWRRYKDEVLVTAFFVASPQLGELPGLTYAGEAWFTKGAGVACTGRLC